MSDSIPLNDPIHLVIVDFQYDFYSSNGALSVPHADKAQHAIEHLLNSGKVEAVSFTADWHIPHHPSFTDEGGIWPRHCVQHSRGAAIAQPLLEACWKHNIPYQIYTKAERLEEYGAFTRIPDELKKAKNIWVAGLAGDYCVRATLINLLEVKPKVFLPGIASIDDGTALNMIIQVEDLETVE